MNAQSFEKIDKAELNARLLSIDIVSWQWNERGLAIHAAENRPEKLKNTPEIGVIAQDIRDKLQDLFPDIIVYHSTGLLMVNYYMLGELSKTVLHYLNDIYQKNISNDLEINDKLNLDALLKKYQTDDIQLYATKLLALVKIYNQRINTIILT